MNIYDFLVFGTHCVSQNTEYIQQVRNLSFKEQFLLFTVHAIYYTSHVGVLHFARITYLYVLDDSYTAER
jgi:hypothetical protein